MALEAAMAEACDAFDVKSDSLASPARREPPRSLEMGLDRLRKHFVGTLLCGLAAYKGPQVLSDPSEAITNQSLDYLYLVVPIFWEIHVV